MLWQGGLKTFPLLLGVLIPLIPLIRGFRRISKASLRLNWDCILNRSSMCRIITVSTSAVLMALLSLRILPIHCRLYVGLKLWIRHSHQSSGPSTTCRWRSMGKSRALFWKLQQTKVGTLDALIRDSWLMPSTSTLTFITAPMLSRLMVVCMASTSHTCINEKFTVATSLGTTTSSAWALQTRSPTMSRTVCWTMSRTVCSSSPSIPAMTTLRKRTEQRRTEQKRTPQPTHLPCRANLRLQSAMCQAFPPTNHKYSQKFHSSVSPCLLSCCSIFFE